MAKLWCALVGKKSNVFSVNIDASEHVDDLKEEIKKKLVIAFPASELELYWARAADGSWLDSTSELAQQLKTGAIPAPIRGMVDSSNRLVADDTIEEALKNTSQRQRKQIQVLVVVPPPALPPNDGVKASKKRKLADLALSLTPSSFAKCKGKGSWVRWLTELNGQVECHRIDRSDTTDTAIPIVLLNETFARFEKNCKEISFGNVDCEFVMNLCSSMSDPYESQAQLAAKARELLNDYLLADFLTSSITQTTVNGSVSDGSYRFRSTLLLNLTCRLQKGDGGGDPTMQNIAFYITTLPRVVDRQFPCLLLDFCGPLLSVSGIVNMGDETAVCEPLVMSFPLLFFDNQWLLAALTHVCAALKAAVKELTHGCEQLAASDGQRTIHLDRLRYPYKASFSVGDSEIAFDYVQRVQRYVFLARLHDGTEVIVNFAKRYGEAMHQFCADGGFAPALIALESLPSGWKFIVMERLSLTTLATAIAMGKGSIIRHQLRELQQRLASARLVHGDLRENNAMWDSSEDRVVLIDFDWSGEDGIDTYPPFMSSEIAWPPEAECGKPLRIAHDAYWVDMLLVRVGS